MNALIAYGDSLDDFVIGFYVWTPDTVSADARSMPAASAPPWACRKTR